MGPMEETLVRIFFPVLLGETTVGNLIKKLLDLGDKHAGLGVLNPATTVYKGHKPLLSINKHLV